MNLMHSVSVTVCTMLTGAALPTTRVCGAPPPPPPPKRYPLEISLDKMVCGGSQHVSYRDQHIGFWLHKGLFMR
jgi:hypothetical protein